MGDSAHFLLGCERLGVWSQCLDVRVARKTSVDCRAFTGKKRSERKKRKSCLKGGIQNI